MGEKKSSQKTNKQEEGGKKTPQSCNKSVDVYHIFSAGWLAIPLHSAVLVVVVVGTRYYRSIQMYMWDIGHTCVSSFSYLEPGKWEKERRAKLGWLNPTRSVSIVIATSQRRQLPIYGCHKSSSRWVKVALTLSPSLNSHRLRDTVVKRCDSSYYTSYIYYYDDDHDNDGPGFLNELLL